MAKLDENKKAMTLEHLLTMSTGLDCKDSYLYRWQGMREMMSSDDWVQYVLDLPMKREPGQRFEYCNGASHLLSAIITGIHPGYGMVNLAVRLQCELSARICYAVPTRNLEIHQDGGETDETGKALPILPAAIVAGEWLCAARCAAVAGIAAKAAER